MKKIHRLSTHLISKIAAGEVIERPAYAVKELLENALDAKATMVEIQIEESGLKRITVIDNGEGMSKEDLEICFLPHTTSKLKPDDDLTKITSLGFRGEALAALAAVSHVTIITRTQKDIGGRIIQIRGGIVEDSAPIGSPVGTIVTAEGLFYSVPARKKFLKSAQTEFRHITEIVNHYGAMYPNVHFILKHNKKTIIDLAPTTNFEERTHILLGPTLQHEMLPVSFEDGHITIMGEIGKPQVSLKQNQKQFIFINNRHITDRMLSLSVREAFGTLLPASYTPVFVLQITLPHELVDVNVHPRKEQVAFTDPKKLFDAVKTSVTNSLQQHNITFQLGKFKVEHSAKLGETRSNAGLMLKEIVLPWNRIDPIRSTTETTYTQIQQTYILTHSQAELFFIDQHAAHERILYNRFRTAFQKQAAIAEQLLKPVRFDLSLTDSQVLKEHTATLQNMGFTIEPFQGTTFILRSVPKAIAGRKYEKIIMDLLGELGEDRTPQSLEKSSHRMLAFLACRAAVKAGDVLQVEQMKDMVTSLRDQVEHETCPHGRPTTLLLPLDDLHRKFRRQ